MAGHGEQPPRKVLRADALGRKQLKGETREWARQAGAIARILEANRRRPTMSFLRNLAVVCGIVSQGRVEREMDEELRGYLDAAVNEKMRRGTSREEAMRAARMEMGGAESVKEQSAREWSHWSKRSGRI